MSIRRTFTLITLIAVALAFSCIGLQISAAEPTMHDVRPGYGVTRIGWLSDYHAPLKATPVDTRVYYLESEVPGPTLFILGGTHSNEIAGIMSATLFVERAVATAGRIIVVPYANPSGASYPDTLHPQIGFYTITTKSGPRTFRYGDRRTNPEHQGPDPDQYIHYPTGVAFDGNEARNLDRAHPGKADGTLTQQLAYAYHRLLIDEEVDVAFDLHEAGVTSRLANMVIANPKNLDYAVIAIVDLELQGIVMNVEHSDDQFPGLSHREWGDHTQAAAYLIETPNPGQTPGITDPDVVNDPVNPLARRVATHLAAIDAVLAAHEMVDGQRTKYTGLPSYDDLIKFGLGEYLR
ncbi:MAG: hypothetical protein GX183_04330 [Firmicutes bacterium]|jgi:hypothetical protein|nr:hypothetical protein [Bacillota bacterium]